MSVQDNHVRILLADEQSLFREAVRVVLESEPDLRVVGEARDGVQALAEAERLEPDVALVDASLPNTDGLEATSQIRMRVPGCRVLVLGRQEEDLPTLVGALESGATGYLTKECPLAELIDATRSVHRGETLVPPRMLGPLLSQLVQRRREQSQAMKRVALLTKREKEVLALLADGAGNDRIAQALVISPETARTHIQNVLGKLGVHSRLEAAAFVVQNDMVDELMEARV